MTRTIKLVFAREYVTQESGFVRKQLEATVREMQGNFGLFIEKPPLARLELTRIGAMWQHGTERDMSWRNLTLEEKLRFVTESEASQLERTLISNNPHSQNIPYGCGNLVHTVNEENPGRIQIIGEPHDARSFELEDEMGNATQLLLKSPSSPESVYYAMLVVLNYCEASMVRSALSAEYIINTVPEDGFGIVVRDSMQVALAHMLRERNCDVIVEATEFQHPILDTIQEILAKGVANVDFDRHAQAYLNLIKEYVSTPQIIWQGMLLGSGRDHIAQLIQLAPGTAIIQHLE
ncbi:MAG: hypothetical protein ABII22_04085 [Candidatus Micrarchaeota archaeon]